MLFFLFGWKVKCLPVNICLIVFLLLNSSLYLRKNVKFLHKRYVMEYDFNSFKHYIFTRPHFASGRYGVWEYGDEWVKCTNGTTTATITKKKKKNWKMTLPYIFLLSVLLAQTFYTLSFHLLITQNHIPTHCTSIMQHHFRHCSNKSLAQSISSPTCKRIV